MWTNRWILRIGFDCSAAPINLPLSMNRDGRHSNKSMHSNKTLAQHWMMMMSDEKILSKEKHKNYLFYINFELAYIEIPRVFRTSYEINFAVPRRSAAHLCTRDETIFQHLFGNFRCSNICWCDHVKLFARYLSSDCVYQLHCWTEYCSIVR